LWVVFLVLLLLLVVRLTICLFLIILLIPLPEISLLFVYFTAGVSGLEYAPFLWSLIDLLIFIRDCILWFFGGKSVGSWL